MEKDKIYWTTKSGKKIDVDEMTEDHLRNTLKMIIRNADSRVVNEEFEKYKNNRIKGVQNDEPHGFNFL